MDYEGDCPYASMHWFAKFKNVFDKYIFSRQRRKFKRKKEVKMWMWLSFCNHAPVWLSLKKCLPRYFDQQKKILNQKSKCSGDFFYSVCTIITSRFSYRAFLWESAHSCFFYLLRMYQWLQTTWQKGKYNNLVFLFPRIESFSLSLNVTWEHMRMAKLDKVANITYCPFMLQS